MPTQYAGLDNYPTQIDVPSDGDAAEGATFAPGYEGLADRTRWLRLRMLNVNTRVTAGSLQNFGACFVPGYDELWVVGEYNSNAQVMKSKNLGLTFARETAIDAAIITNPTHEYGIAANANGDLIVVNSAAHWQSYDRATTTWYADGWTSPGSWTRIVYLPTVDRFVIVGVTGTNLTAQRTPVADIHNANTPTTQIGAAGTWYNFTTGLAVDVATGRVAAVGLSSSQPRVAYSTDAGDNWTTLAGLATTIATPTWADICHGGDGYWYLVVGETSGTHTGEVWRSVDATSWTKVATFTSDFVKCIAGFGAFILGVTAAGSIVSSVDNGATWQRHGFVVEGTPLRIENLHGRAVILTSTKAYVSTDVGSPTGASIA